MLSIFHSSASKCHKGIKSDAWGVLDNVLLSAAMCPVVSPGMSFMPLMYVCAVCVVDVKMSHV